LFRGLTVVDAGDANIVPAWIERGHAFIYRKVREVAATGAIPIVLGGDHSITWPSATALADVRRPGSIGIVHFDAHADTANEDWGVLAGHGTPMRRLIESGAVQGRNFVQVGLRGYWPPVDVFDWMQEQGMRWHLMREIEERARRPSSPMPSPRPLTGPRRSMSPSTSMSSTRARRPAPGRPSRVACCRASCSGPSARSLGRSSWPGWTSSS
jgi:agmatinase